MFNEWLWLGFAIVNFCFILAAYQLFGKSGLFGWIALSTILANVQVVKTVELFGIIATLGNIMYGTGFLATDILNEKYGRRTAQKGVAIGFFSLLVMTVLMQIAIRFVPHEFDVSQEALKTIFGIQIRVAVGSLAAYLISQYVDVRLYSLLKNKFSSNRYLWVRNNGSTMISQLLDTLIFCTIAFLGVFPTNEWVMVVLSTYVIKWLVAVLDTPFLYIAKQLQPKQWD
ncbi:queuosine precursor transporter [Bacillus tianshenii]|nr:queuosine precursor transporter [Bacillus tianshenii]